MMSHKRNSLDESENELVDISEDPPPKKNRFALEDWDASVSQDNAQLNTQVLSQLDCPVCLETCLPPIFACRNGHVVCGKCQPQMKECGSCRLPGKPTMRCLQLEKIAALLICPCPNKASGCSQVLCCDEMSKHIPKCEYGIPCFLCKEWKGCGKDLKAHIEAKHSHKCCEIPPNGITTRYTNLPMKKAAQNKRFFVAFFYNEDIFWSESHFSSSTRLYSKTLRIASNDVEKASRYIYTIEFKAKEEKNKYEMFFQGEMQTMEGKDGGMKIVIPAPIIDSYEGESIAHTVVISLKK